MILVVLALLCFCFLESVRWYVAYSCFPCGLLEPGAGFQHMDRNWSRSFYGQRLMSLIYDL